MAGQPPLKISDYLTKFTKCVILHTVLPYRCSNLPNQDIELFVSLELSIKKYPLKPPMDKFGKTPLLNLVKIRVLLLVIIGVFSLLPGPTWANLVQTEYTTARLISEKTAIYPGEPVWVALQLTPIAGWHTYWRNPGDSGKATQINWDLPDGIQASDIHWPHPKRIAAGPLMNFGYYGEANLLVKLNTEGFSGKNLSEVNLAAKANWLVCEEICVPESADLNLVLPVTTKPAAPDSNHKNLFAETRQLLPTIAPWASVFTQSETNLVLQVALDKTQTQQLKSAELFPYRDGIIENAAVQHLEHGEHGIRLTVLKGYEPPEQDFTGELVLKFKDTDRPQAFSFGAQAVDHAPEFTPLAETGNLSFYLLLQTMLFAFLGGLILNLMPCVFPVLSLKALAIVEKARHDTAFIRRQGLVFTTGVLSSFLVVAGILLAFRAAGAQVGWGFQLQSPPFVMILAYILFMVGLNLSGVFNFGTRMMGIGQNLSEREGLSGAFFTGALATVVATPCSAPFMAPALGVAIAQPASIALLIFLMLGFGLAFPFLLISFSPGLQRFLPKPGPWMDTLKQLLAFPMYGAVIWLIWVLGRQTGIDGATAALIGMLLLALAAWLYERSRNSSKLAQGINFIALAGCLIVALILIGTPKSTGESVTEAPKQADASGLNWEPYSATKLAELRDTGQAVFLNLTAAWCITCIINEKVALSSPVVADAFRKHNIAYLKGDWTNEDPAITKLLSQFDRSGVPLYVLYYPTGDNRKPKVLPQILTEQMVLDSLNTI